MNEDKNKRIAKNTMLLYVRMFLILVVGLYTSRVVLKTLGVNDYGIYNIVGGFVTMLAYINSVFVVASQRYLSYSIGKGDEEQLHRIFCTSVSIHAVLGIVILILAETVGLWFVNNCLNIDPLRMDAANWVYQCSILTLMINIIAIPYNANIVAHEHMNVFAKISIVDVLMKLVIVYALLVVAFDKLIAYAILMVVVTLLVSVIYIWYCRHNFRECHYEILLDRSQIKNMSSFAGWTAIGTLGFTFKDQLLNIILNIFFGTAVNAARGVAVQVSSMTNQFSTNFFMAVSPQIIKRYASGNLAGSRQLVYNSAKYAFFLMSIVTIPLLINLRYLLELWLGHVPMFTYEFLLVILTGTLIASLASSSTTALQATGNIKIFQISVATLFLLEVPLAYLLLKLGYNPYIAIAPSIITQMTGVILRFYILSRQVEGYEMIYFLVHIVLRSIVVTTISLLLCIWIYSIYHKSTFFFFLLSSMVNVGITATLIYVMGLTTTERKVIRNYAIKIYNRISSH